MRARRLHLLQDRVDQSDRVPLCEAQPSDPGNPPGRLRLRLGEFYAIPDEGFPRARSSNGCTASPTTSSTASRRARSRPRPSPQRTGNGTPASPNSASSSAAGSPRTCRTSSTTMTRRSTTTGPRPTRSSSSVSPASCTNCSPWTSTSPTTPSPSRSWAGHRGRPTGAVLAQRPARPRRRTTHHPPRRLRSPVGERREVSQRADELSALLRGLSHEQGPGPLRGRADHQPVVRVPAPGNASPSPPPYTLRRSRAADSADLPPQS